MWVKSKKSWYLKAAGYVMYAASIHVGKEAGKLVCSTTCGWRTGPEFNSVTAAKKWCEAAVAENSRATGKQT